MSSLETNYLVISQFINSAHNHVAACMSGCRPLQTTETAENNAQNNLF